MNTENSLFIIAIVAAITILTRVLPFIVFRSGKVPKYISYLGNVLPVAIVAMLIVYCLKGMSFTVYPYGIPEIFASLVVVILHIWKRNTLLSIFSGTIAYMLLKQLIF